jgi:hypothetical protein
VRKRYDPKGIDTRWSKYRPFWRNFFPGRIHNYVTGVTPEQPSKSTSPNARAGGRGRGSRGGRGGGNGGRRGRGGRAKGRGRGEPDPPEPTKILNQEEKDEIAHLKARQNELKRFFSTVGAQQMDILEQLATRDMNRLAKRPNAHKKLPEYDELMKDLESAKVKAENLAKMKYEIQLEAEMRRYETEKAVIEARFKVYLEP